MLCIDFSPSAQESLERMRRLLKEPLFHFFIAGAALFLVYFGINDNGATENSRRIDVTPNLREFVRARFQRTWQRQATPAEEQRAVEEWIREEILFREGMALGLAQNDPLARRRIGQKLMMLAEAATPPLPNDDTLREWFEARADEYQQPLVYTLEQVFFADSGEGANVRAQSLLASLTPENANVPLGDQTLLPATLDSAPASYIESSFGKAFSDSLADLPLGSWQGPVQSTFGAHLVRLRSRSGGETPDLEAVRAVVERDWLYERTKTAKEDFYTRLRAAYRVEGLAQVESVTRP